MNISWNVSDKAAALHENALVWDNVWPLEPSCGNDFATLHRFLGAGFNVVSITLAGDNHNISQAAQRVAAARRKVFDGPSFLLIERIQDVAAAKAAKRLGIVLHFEGTRCFERNLDMVEAFYALGIRQTLLAFNQANSVGGGCAEERDGGLTRFGRSLIKEMQRVGMLVDLSHTGRVTTLDALELAEKPMVFTHSNVNAIQPHPRNLQDEQIKRCAATGGLIGISGSSVYLGDDMGSNEAIFRHIDYVAQLVGAEHVGLGLDLVADADAVNRYIKERPEEWPMAQDPQWPGFRYGSPEQIPGLTELMLKNGYLEANIRAILGENYLRVCEQVWR
jgi:membrane dipeptidase